MTRETNNTVSASDEISIKELILKVDSAIRYLRSKWIKIVLFSIVGAIFGYLYGLQKKTLYTATTSFVLEDANGGGGSSQYAGLASMIGLNVSAGSGGGIFQGENIFELYKSRNMIQKTLLSTVFYKGKNQLLIERYIDLNKLREEWKDPKLKRITFNLKDGQQFTRLQDSVLGKVVDDIDKKYLKVSKSDAKLSIINVDVQSTDEAFAKDFDNQIVKTVNDFYVQTKTKRSLENLAVLQHQTDSVKNVLNGAIYQTVAVADATPNLNSTRQVLRIPVQRSQFNVEANKAILTQLVQNLELAKIALRKETPLIQVIDDPIMPLPVLSVNLPKYVLIFAFLGCLLATMVLSVHKIYTNLINGQ